MTTKTPLFTIIIPAYKDQFLAESIESILTQTCPDFELIIVNDGSPYNLDKIVQNYNDSRIHYYKRALGFGAARLVDNWNDCLVHAKGTWVICMGDDDRLLPNCLADYVDLITRHPEVGVCHARTQLIDENGIIKKTTEDVPEWMSVYRLMYLMMCRGYETFVGDFAYRTSALRNWGGYFSLPYAWHSDRITSLTMAKAHGLACTKRPGFQFRKNRLQVSNDTTITEQKLLVWDRVHDWYKRFLSVHPENPEDEKFWRGCDKQLDGFIEWNINHDISVDLASHPTHTLCYAFRVKSPKLPVRLRLLFLRQFAGYTLRDILHIPVPHIFK